MTAGFASVIVSEDRGHPSHGHAIRVGESSELVACERAAKAHRDQLAVNSDSPAADWGLTRIPQAVPLPRPRTPSRRRQQLGLLRFSVLQFSVLQHLKMTAVRKPSENLKR